MAKPLVISNWQNGIAPSPYLGFQRIVNCDISSSPGGLKVNRKTAKKTATTVDAQVNWIVRDPDTPANIFALDANGVLYKSANSGTSWAEVSNRGGTGQGLAVQWGYVFVIGDDGASGGQIDVMKISDSSWTTDWQTVDYDSLWSPMIVSKNDGKIYGGAGQYIFSIEQNSGQVFVPATGATFTFTQQALDLPENYRIKCLTELGSTLMIGTWQGASVFQIRNGDIFPWDRSSTSFNLPIELFENGVHAMITIQNQLYIFAGVTGTIYVSNGYSTQKLAQIPESLVSVTTDTAGGLYEFYPGSVMNYRGKIYFGIGNNVATVGVFSVDIQTGVLNVEHLISTGEDGSTSSATTQSVTALLATSCIDFLLGWQDNATYGIDLTSLKYTGFAAFAESALYQIGTKKRPEAFTEVECLLSKPLATGQGVKIKYRRSLTTTPTTSSTWTTIREYLYSGTADADTKIVAGAMSINDIFKIDDITSLQIRVELTTPGTGDDTPELLSVIFR